MCRRLVGLAVVLWFQLVGLDAHLHHGGAAAKPESGAGQELAAGPVPGITGQAPLRFRLLFSTSHLPEAARQVVAAAHGGFAVDRREGRGEAYFALPGAGILQISADLDTIRLLETPPPLKNVNLHNTTVWYGPDGTAYLTFPANDAGAVFTTSLEGRLLHTLEPPSGRDDFSDPTVNEYFRSAGKFAPTDVDWLDGLLFITTGYSSLDSVLTARVRSFQPFDAVWNRLAFAGRGTEPGRLGTGHGITVPPGIRRLDVADRPHSEIDRYSPEGSYLSTLSLPAGAYPCDIDYLDDYAVVGCLHGPDRSRGAPIYILKGDRVISTLLPRDDLGLENFQHVHNAVLVKINGRLHVIAQSWNPGDFAVLEQVSE